MRPLPFITLSALLALSMLLACNNRRGGGGRGPTSDSGMVTLDSAMSSDSSARDTLPGSDTGAPADSSTGLDSTAGSDTGRPPGVCEVMDSSEGLGSAVFSGTTVGRANGFAGDCGGGDAPEVIVSWLAPTSGLFEFNTSGSDYDTVLYARRPGCASPDLACNDDAMGAASAITLTLMAGEEIYLFIDGFSSNEGSFVVNVNLMVP